MNPEEPIVFAVDTDKIQRRGVMQKMRARSLAELGADGGKVGHSFRKGLVDSHLGVIEDSADTGVGLPTS